MSAPLAERWYSTEWERSFGRYSLSVAIDITTYAWEVVLGRAVVAKGTRPDEKAAKLAARRWAEANP